MEHNGSVSDHMDGLQYSTSEIEVVPGNFNGHILAGSFIISYGTFRCYMVMRQFFLCQRAASLEPGTRRRAKTFYNMFSYPTRVFPRVPIEAFVVTISALLGSLYEYLAGLKKLDGSHAIKLENLHHMSVYFFIALPAPVFLIEYYRGRLLPHVTYLAVVMAYLMEGSLFYFHLDGRTPVNKLVHTFLFYMIMGGALSTIAEIMDRRSITAAVSRAYFTILQGTWFCQLAWFLYTPFTAPFDQHSHKTMMLITMVNTWYYAIVFLYVCCIASITKRCVWSLDQSDLYKELETDPFDEIMLRNGLKGSISREYFDDQQSKALLTDMDDEA